MRDRFKFRIPEFTDKGSFNGFQCVELGDEVECTLCGYNGDPQQCTGLRDKKNKLIYEGDIVKAACNRIRAKNSLVKGVIKYDNENCQFIVAHRYSGFTLTDSFETFVNFEIIGNILENEDLLEEE